MVVSTECKCVLEYISQAYNINIEELLQKANDALKERVGVFDRSLCHAKVKSKQGKYSQCSRAPKYGIYCITHYKKSQEPEGLKHGVYNNTYESTHDHDKAYVKPKLVRGTKDLEWIMINHVDYLYDAVTFAVYDFNTRSLIGKLDIDGDIILKH